MPAIQKSTVDRFWGADDGVDLRDAADRWNDAYSLVVCLLGAAVRPGTSAASPAERPLLRVAPRKACARSRSRGR